jgi:hypothetical protein
MIISKILQYVHLRRLGGRKLSTQVASIMYALIDDSLAAQLSLRGATRHGAAKKSFAEFGLLPLITSKWFFNLMHLILVKIVNIVFYFFNPDIIWSHSKSEKKSDIEDAVADHLINAGTRIKRALAKKNTTAAEVHHD